MFGRTQLWTRVAEGGESRAAAPEFAGIERWLNSEPLTMRELRGKVVLVDFWTLGCVNCIETLPHVEKWWETYRDRGLVVVGVHTPETPEERRLESLAEAVHRFGLHYPIAHDSSSETWKAYGNHSWPALYLVDAQGRIADQWFGEGSYYEIEASIRDLLERAKTSGTAAQLR
ncbi:MAG TPA: redoxin domain-containing protein [Myxococcota bacterium]|nr:redoxin domain-containing protein [Myxococcota bacterium]